MQEIQLTGGKKAIVCDCHAHLVIRLKWYAHWAEHTKSFRAARDATASELMSGAKTTIYMHAVINNTPRGFHTDHINHDTLDNRCCNLRTVTISENICNARKQSNNTSGYRGVSWDKKKKKWQACIGNGGKSHKLGYFNTAEQAARAYDEAARKHHGKFAYQNFKVAEHSDRIE